MRLLFVIDNLSTGGAQRQMISLALGLHKRGQEVSFFHYYPGQLLADRLYDAHIPICFSQKRGRFSSDVVNHLSRHIRERNPDLVLSYLITSNVYAVISTLGMRRKPKVVVSERSYDLPGQRLGTKHLYRQLYRFADFIVANSHHQRQNLVDRYAWMAHKITTIYNGVDLEVFKPAEEQPPGDPLRLLAIGSIRKTKNGLCLVRALAILRDRYGLRPCVDWAGQHVASDKSHDAYFRQMDQEIADLGLTEQWRWLYQQTNVVELYNTHHALVHPSYLEGMSNVVCEALACGRPVIASNTLDHPRLVQDGASGYLFDWRDPEALAMAIKRFYDLSPEERREMGRKGRLFAEQNLSLDRLADDYESLFERLLA